MDRHNISRDYALRATWQAVTQQNVPMKRPKSLKATMAVGFTLLSIDPKSGSPQNSSWPKMAFNGESNQFIRNTKKYGGKGLIERRPPSNDGKKVVLIHYGFWA